MTERFLADENFPLAAARAMRAVGQDVVHIAEVMPGAEDVDVAAEAVRRDAILLTFDRDFGELTFRRSVSTVGIVLFRLRRQPPSVVLPFLASFFESGLSLRGYFTVAEPGQIRQRPLLRFLADDE